MKSHEYQAKQLLASYGVPVERGVVVWDADKADKALHMLGRRPRYVVKAQVHSGGRGKGHFADGFPGGGVQMAKSPEEVERLLRGMLHNRLITAQNAPKGNLVTAVYIAEAIDMVQQFYVAVFIDRKRQQPLILVSKDGGMDIESLAETNPEKFFREYVSTTYGLEEYQVRRIAFWLGIKDDNQRAVFQRILYGMYRIFWGKDASLVEINPLAMDAEGRMYALDAKITFEDNGLVRHDDVANMRDPEQEDEKEVRASEYGLNYVALDGTVACLTNGAGLAMATMDMLHGFGIRPANFLDLGDNSGIEAIAEAFRILLSDKEVRCVLVNIFGGAMRGDLVADGILQALNGEPMPLPLVVRLEGANAEKGRKFLAESLRKTVFANDLSDIGKAILQACPDIAQKR